MAGTHLMSEEDVRQYFLQNNGIVRNTDIVNYFRPYLSDPSIRDEARALFKSYVNKLSNVKTENGEKFLVLKRQYFHPIDGNGNGRPMPGIPTNSYGHPALTPSPSYSSIASSNPPYNPPPNPYANMNNSSLSTGYAPLRTEPIPLPSLSRPPLQRSLSQQSYSMSQSHLYGSAYSLGGSSNYSDPYYGNSSVHSSTPMSGFPPNPIPPPQYPPPTYGNMDYRSGPPGHMTSNADYLDYGLPPIPPPHPLTPPRRHPSGSAAGGGSSPGSPMRLPPPYRPPPPLPVHRFPAPVAAPPLHAVNTAAPLRNPISLPPRFPSPPQSYPSEPAPSRSSALLPHQYQRSLSVPGGVTTSGATEGLPLNSSESIGALPTPPPPVPPRSKRGTFDRTGGGCGAGGSSARPAQLALNLMMSDFNEINAGDDLGGFEDFRSERSNSMGADGKLVVGGGGGSGGGGELLRRSNSEGAAGVLGDFEPNDNDNKENVDLANGNSGDDGGTHTGSSTTIDGSGGEEGSGGLNGNCVNGNVNSDVEQKISVKERLQKFNRIASESELATSPTKMPSATRSRRENTSNKHESVDFDTASLSSFGFGFAHMQPKEKEWILKAATCDYHALNKMAQENPSLVKRKDMNGYTALHWAAKHGNVDLVKLLAGTFKSDVNSKSNGGYTPLHLAAQFSRQDVYDILSQVYNADTNIRDYSGKKPMQYLVRQDTTVSMDTFKKLKEKRRSNEHRERDSFLRIGSLNVRVKKTTEAFGNFLGKSNSTASIERILHKSWGSADNIPEADGLDKDKQLMPPPAGGNVRRTTSKVNGKRRARRSAPAGDSLPIKESHTDSDSDTACGFGSEWQNGS